MLWNTVYTINYNYCWPLESIIKNVIKNNTQVLYCFTLENFFSELDKDVSKTININTLDSPSLMHWMSRLFIVFSTSLYKVKLFWFLIFQTEDHCHQPGGTRSSPLWEKRVRSLFKASKATGYRMGAIPQAVDGIQQSGKTGQEEIMGKLLLWHFEGTGGSWPLGQKTYLSSGSVKERNWRIRNKSK